MPGMLPRAWRPRAWRRLHSGGRQDGAARQHPAIGIGWAGSLCAERYQSEHAAGHANQASRSHDCPNGYRPPIVATGRHRAIKTSVHNCLPGRGGQLCPRHLRRTVRVPRHPAGPRLPHPGPSLAPTCGRCGLPAADLRDGSVPMATVSVRRRGRHGGRVSDRLRPVPSWLCRLLRSIGPTCAGRAGFTPAFRAGPAVPAFLAPGSGPDPVEPGRRSRRSPS